MVAFGVAYSDAVLIANSYSTPQSEYKIFTEYIYRAYFDSILGIKYKSIF